MAQMHHIKLIEALTASVYFAGEDGLKAQKSRT